MPGGLTLADLSGRLGVGAEDLGRIQVVYREFIIPKKSGGQRRIHAPVPALRTLQRKILCRVLGRLKCHPCATGFERGHSIVTNARVHAGRAVVIRMDLKDFFTTTTSLRVQDYFQRIGWNQAAAELLTRVCTHEGGLPQGAPTSPRLSNLVNIKLDARLAGLSAKLGAAYTRYADDLTFSFGEDDPRAIHKLIDGVRRLARRAGYRVHRRKKFHIRRRHDRQVVTGLVVNQRARLARSRRRWLRAVEHRLALGRPASLTPAQMAGWRSFQRMVAAQSFPSGG